LDHQNNYIEYLNVDNAVKNFNILATSLSVLHNYSDSSKIIFRSVSSQISRSLAKDRAKSFLFMYI